jgi:hypothetical protein
MAEYHDLSTFLETARAVLSQIVQHNRLADASINGPVISDFSLPSLTLKWEAEDGIAEKNINVSVFDRPGESIAEVDISAWRDIERREEIGTRKFRRMVCKGVETLRNIQQYDSEKALRELNGALWQAYAQTSQLDLHEFWDGFQREVEDAPGLRSVTLEDRHATP